MRDSRSDDNFSDVTNVMAFPIITGYKIIKFIGKGAHSLVFKGIEKKSRRKVAIKVLKPSLGVDEKSLKRFLLELEVVIKLSHPYIIKVYAVGKSVEPYIVMEYLKISLSSLLQGKRGKFPKRDALKIVRRLAKALEYAHDRGIIHRDIKPANILFRKTGHPVLVDFGVVKSLSSPSDFTTTQTVLGTPHYMSPEQCRGEKVDGLSDIYSLGVVLFEMISGKLPYNGKSWAELCKQHTSPSIPLLPLKAKDCQPLIEMMMAKDKNMRIDAARVRTMIEEILSGAKPGKSKGSYQNGILSLIVIGLTITLIIVLILILILI